MDKPAVVRYPRGVGPGVEIEKEMTLIPIGECRTIFEGESIAILSFGSVLDIAKDVAQISGIDPLDKDSRRLLTLIWDSTKQKNMLHMFIV